MMTSHRHRYDVILAAYAHWAEKEEIRRGYTLLWYPLTSPLINATVLNAGNITRLFIFVRISATHVFIFSAIFKGTSCDILFATRSHTQKEITIQTD